MSMEWCEPHIDTTEYANTAEAQAVREKFLTGVYIGNMGGSALDNDGYVLLRVMPKERSVYARYTHIPDNTLYIETGQMSVVRADDFILCYPAVMVEVMEKQDLISAAKSEVRLINKLCGYNVSANPNGTLWVGCHLIKISELNKIAKLLGCG